jgi:hypothetical protein
MARGRLFYGAVAVLGGLVLAESLFMPWYSVDVTVAGVEAGAKLSAWQAMSVMDVLLALAATCAVAGGLAAIRRPELSLVPFAAGAAGIAMSLLGLLDLPAAGVEAVRGDTATVGRSAGPLIALVASFGAAYAGFRLGTLRSATRTAAPTADRAARRAAPALSPRAHRPAQPPR